MQCDDKYVDPSTQREVGVCSREATCTPSPVLGTPLPGVSCECVYPALPNLDYETSLAPYSEAFDGCLVPMQMDDLIIVSDSLTVTLTKPATPSVARNLTLRMRGNDVTRPAHWSVDNDGSLPRWISLSAGSQAIILADTDVSIPIMLSAAGLRERSLPYPASLSVSTRSAAIQVSQQLDVLLLVSARTDAAVWGVVNGTLSGHPCATPDLMSNHSL